MLPFLRSRAKDTKSKTCEDPQDMDEQRSSIEEPQRHPPPDSLANLVLDSKNYSALYAANAKNEAPTQSLPDSSPHSHPINAPANPRTPPTSITDLVLNGVTYDAILAASAKSLSVGSDTTFPPPSPFDTHVPPPNTPTLSHMDYGSLPGAAAKLMESEDVPPSQSQT